MKFAGLIHELRNPLNSLLGSLEILSQNMEEHHYGKDAEIEEILEIGIDSGEFLLMMVNNVLDHSRL